MAGGVGSRFWPKSTPERPKQFLDILHTGKTMIQQAVERVRAFCPFENIFIVTSKKYVSLVLDQIEGLGNNQVLVEPCMRNTAPCIAYAVWKIKLIDQQARILVLPSDSYIPDTDAFVRDVELGLNYVESEPAIMTLGIKPVSPDTGYGYIESLPDECLHNQSIYPVISFREKPSLDKARKYLSEGSFFWNAGIFMANADTFIAAFKEFLPNIAMQFDAGVGFYNTQEEQAFIDEMYPSCENISIDYGIMEKASNIVVKIASFPWSDVGTWNTVHELQMKDENGNTFIEFNKMGQKVIFEQVTNCLVSIPESSETIIEGVSDLIIVQSENRLLICQMKNVQRIKEFTDRF